MDLSNVSSFLSFVYGGMENWGCIFYPSSLLLSSSSKKSSDLVRTLSVIAHEMSHNWFGNLVTYAWFNELWLAEGFATHTGWKAVAAIRPHWDVDCLVFSEELERGLLADAFESTHAVHVR